MKFNIKSLLMTSLAVIFSLSFTACGDDDSTEIIDSSLPVGTFSASLSGSFVEQNDTGSTGTAELGTDEEETQFLHFGSDFMTNLGTGTVTVFLSTTNEDLSNVFDPGNGNQNIQLVGIVNSNGEQYFKFDDPVDSKFNYVILWCASAGIPFGYAELQ